MNHHPQLTNRIRLPSTYSFKDKLSGHVSCGITAGISGSRSRKIRDACFPSPVGDWWWHADHTFSLMNLHRELSMIKAQIYNKVCVCFFWIEVDGNKKWSIFVGLFGASTFEFFSQEPTYTVLNLGLCWLLNF